MMVANTITGFRLFVLLPLFVWLVLMGQVTWGTIIFFIAWALDGIDGWVARRLHEESERGSMLDKLTDRLIIGTALFLFVGQGIFPVWALCLILKDALLFLVPFRNSLAGSSTAGAGVLGKVATLLQGISIIWLMVHGPYPELVVGITSTIGVIAALKYLYRTS